MPVAVKVLLRTDVDLDSGEEELSLDNPLLAELKQVRAFAFAFWV